LVEMDTDGWRGQRRMGEARTRQALTSRKGHGRMGPGMDFCCRRAGSSVDSSLGRMVPSTDSSRESGCGLDHCDRVQTRFETHTTTAKQMHVRARMGGHRARMRTGPCWNGHRHYVSAHGCRRGACSYGRGGINKTPTYFVFAILSIQISSLSQHA
jgi:hypothetical protein